MDCKVIKDKLFAIRALAHAAEMAIGEGDSTACNACVRSMREALDVIDEQNRDWRGTRDWFRLGEARPAWPHI